MIDLDFMIRAAAHLFRVGNAAGRGESVDLDALGCPLSRAQSAEEVDVYPAEDGGVWLVGDLHGPWGVHISPRDIDPDPLDAWAGDVGPLETSC